MEHNLVPLIPVPAKKLTPALAQNEAISLSAAAGKTAPVKHSNANPITRAELDAMRDRDRVPVDGVFRHYETPGATLPFVYLKYLGDQVERYDLTDGHRYTIPYGVAKHLNK